MSKSLTIPVTPDLEALGVAPTQPVGAVPISEGKEPMLIIGFDSEYISGGSDDGRKNNVLSYQCFGLDPVTLQQWFWAVDVEGGDRMELRDIIVETLLRGKALGKFHRWPVAVYLVIHWSLADLTSIANFNEIKASFDGVRRTYTTLGKPLEFDFYDKNRNKREIKLSIRDTMLLAPATSRSLETLGKVINLDKVDLPKEEMKDLRPLKARSPQLYWRYAMRDAEIAAWYYLSVVGAARKMLGSPELHPVTLGGLAPRLTLYVWSQQDIDYRSVLGLERVPQKRYVGKSKKFINTFEDVDCPRKQEFNELAIRAYFGGRNESFFFGATPMDQWFDYDLCSAYVTAMACLGMPKWNELRQVESIDELTPEVIGAAYVSFEFPSNVRFPCLPVAAETGLIFPRCGECWATAPEVWLARELGAKVLLADDSSQATALKGFVLEMEPSTFPFDEVASYIHKQRSIHKKETSPLLHNMYKEIGNSVYGKLAQAVRPRKLFNTRYGMMETLGPSKITNAYLAEHTTGLVRAVLSEIINKVPSGFMVVSVTTDGFLTNLPEDRLSELVFGRLAQQFAQARQRICDDPRILETKHKASQVLSFRTRGQATLAPEPREPPVFNEPDESAPEALPDPIIAKAGIKTKKTMPWDANDEIIEMFIHRTPTTKYLVQRFRGLREIYEGEGECDLNNIEQVIQYRMDFDWKRRPTERGVREIVGRKHLWFETKPVDSLIEYEHLRSQWRAFNRTHEVTLKMPDDLSGFEDYLAAYTPGVHRTKTGKNALHTAKKAFLRAYTQRAWTKDRELSNQELADSLTNAGYLTNVHEVENAARKASKILDHCAQPTKDVLLFIGAIRSFLPHFPFERLLPKNCANLVQLETESG